MATAPSNASPLILEDSIAKMRTSQWPTFNIDAEPAQLWTAGGNPNNTLPVYQLGDGSTNSRSSPVQISGTTWKTFTGGYYHCASLKTDNTLWTWGVNTYGQIGDNTSITKSLPVQIGGAVWAKAFAGMWQTVAVKTDGTLWAWGNNDNGGLGDNTTIWRSSPVQIGNLNTWYDAAAGGGYSLYMKTDGTLWSTGSGAALGDGIGYMRSSPIQISGTSWASFSCGYNHAGAIKTDGSMWLWGNNSYGQVGDSTSVTKVSPVQLQGTWSLLSCGMYYTAAIKTDGSLWLWGNGLSGNLGNGQRGNGVQVSSPIQVAGTWSYVTCGWFSTIAQKTDGTLWAWGNNTAGTLALGDQQDRSVPTQLSGSGWSLRNVKLNGSIFAARKPI